MQKNKKSDVYLPTHPSLYCHDEEIEIFDLWQDFKLCKSFKKSALSLWSGTWIVNLILMMLQ